MPRINFDFLVSVTYLSGDNDLCRKLINPFEFYLQPRKHVTACADMSKPRLITR